MTRATIRSAIAIRINIRYVLDYPTIGSTYQQVRDIATGLDQRLIRTVVCSFFRNNGMTLAEQFSHLRGYLSKTIDQLLDTGSTNCLLNFNDMNNKLEPEHQPRVSVIVPTYNRDRLATKTVKYLSHFHFDAYEIIVIDQSDTSFGELASYCEQNSHRITYIKATERGLAKARNDGINHARGEIVLFCDDDIIPSLNLLQAHYGNYADPAIGGVAGRIANKKVSRQQKIGIIQRYTANQHDHFDAAYRMIVDHGQGCNLSFRKSILQQVGGFDERFAGSAFLVETDVCLRVKKVGYQLLYEPTATIIHLKAKKGGCRSLSPADWYYWYGHNYSLFFLKHFNKCYAPCFLCYRLFTIAKGFVDYRNLKIPLSGLKGLVAGRQTYHRFY